MPLKVARRRAGFAACLATSAALVLAAAAPALAVDEAQLSEITCHGFRVTQVGLPPDTEFELVVLDPAAGRVLRELDVDSDGKGTIDVDVRVPLRGLPRVDIEVELDGDEYAETGAELHLPCSPKADRPPPLAGADLPPADDGDGDEVITYAVAGLAGAAAAVFAYLLVMRRRRLSAGES